MVGTFFRKLICHKCISRCHCRSQVSHCQQSTINTHQGLYQYNRLPFGIASAPALFQKAMDSILHGMSGVLYIDDILVPSLDTQSHLKSLDEVFQRLCNHGITVKSSKCQLLCNEDEYLGHVVTAAGVETSEHKLGAILKVPRPNNVKKLQSLLGLINYYRKFVPNLSSILIPSNHMLGRKVQCQWDQE